MGIGNFFGCMPEELSDSRLYGVELDSISGRIAKLLCPNAGIEIKGFEDKDFPDNFFDVVIGNVEKEIKILCPLLMLSWGLFGLESV